MTKCPRCDGRGWSGPVHFNMGDKPHAWKERVDCDFCGGSGEINADKQRAVHLGRQLREKRVAREETLMEAAKRFGMKPSELSAFETGRVGLDAWMHPFATRVALEIGLSDDAMLAERTKARGGLK